MFISKQNLIDAFKKIHLLYSNNPDELTKQGCTQFFSGMRYFLAMAAFEKRHARAFADSTNFQDKNAFVEYVGELVSINDNEYTCNFYDDFKSEKDYKVGSNFYSAGFVDDSRKNPTAIFEYPSRDKNNIILEAQNGKIKISGAGVAAFKRKYLEKGQFNYALILWLVRNENIDSLTKEYIETFLTSRYTDEVAKAMLPLDYSFLSDISLVAKKELLNSEELCLLKKDDANRENEITDSNKMKPFSSIIPSQVIYYGVPGSGKSNKIKNQLKSVPEFQKIRCVFHPEYTNADFVGQIKPTVENGKVEYKFTPGPFAKILRRAYLNPTIPFYLVIEEINRGNAAAIFGDVFQLCDRIKPGDEKDESGYGLGWSSYFTENTDLSDYIRDIASLEADKLESHSDAVMQTHSYSEVKDSAGNPISLNATSYMSLEIKRSDFEGENLRFSENTAIRLPPNLSILATMNTSDQNVFTLDNAFQRRFDMELVRNEFEKGNVDGFKDAVVKAQHNALIEGTDCTWGDFWEKMNDKIVSLNRGLASTEDKRLGPWFVSSVACDSSEAPNVSRKIPAKTFAEKVLKYLWDDAFKFKRPQVFADGLSSLEQVVKKFEEAPVGNLEKLKAIFKEF